MADASGVLNISALLGGSSLPEGVLPAGGTPDGALAGLFSGLVEGAGSGLAALLPPSTTDIASLFAGADAGLPLGFGAGLGSELGATQVLPLPGLFAGAVSLEGQTTVVQTIITQITHVEVTLQQAGIGLEGLGENVDQLTNALVALGVSEEDAASIAEGIIGAIAEAKLKLKLALAQQGEQANINVYADVLALLAAASAAGQLQPVQLSVAQTTVQSLSVSTTHISVQSAFRFKVASGIDLARHISGIEAAPLAPQAGTLAGTDAAAALPVLNIADGKIVPENGLNLTGEGQALAPVALAISASTLVAQAAQAAAAAPVVAPLAQALTGEKVAAADVLAKGSGEVIYRITPNENGLELAEAAPAVGEAVNHLAGQHAQANPFTTPALSTPDAENLTFAQRLAQAEKADVANQVVVQLSKLTSGGGGQVRIQLTPEDLGQITIDLAIKDGQVQGSIAATERVVVEQLARELQTLKQSFADAGLKLGTEGLALMLQGGNSGNANGGQTGNGAGSFAGNFGGTDVATETSQTQSWINPDQLVDVRI